MRAVPSLVSGVSSSKHTGYNGVEKILLYVVIYGPVIPFELFCLFILGHCCHGADKHFSSPDGLACVQHRPEPMGRRAVLMFSRLTLALTPWVCQPDSGLYESNHCHCLSLNCISCCENSNPGEQLPQLEWSNLTSCRRGMYTAYLGQEQEIIDKLHIFHLHCFVVDVFCDAHQSSICLSAIFFFLRNFSLTQILSCAFR